MDLYEVISLVLSGLLVLTGFSAVGLYLWQQRTTRKTASTLIVTQIDRIEENIKALQNAENLDNAVVYKSKRILAQNYWEENRHVLSKYLGEANVRIVEEFYSCAEEIEKAREAICHEVTCTWENKDLIYQAKLLEELYKDQSIDINKTALKAFGKYGSGFTAALPEDMLKHNLDGFTKMSGTVAYDRLRKISYHS